jgi:hypothetical protein
MKMTILLSLVLFATNVLASQTAVTNSGSIVILNDDGTWQFETNVEDLTNNLQKNPIKFRKLPNQIFQVISQKNDASVWIDPKKWSFTKSIDASDFSEFKFKLKGSDLHAMLISEQIEIKIDSLAKLALKNAKDFAPDAKILDREMRFVNNSNVMKMRIGASMESIDFIYTGYYFSSKNGTTQLLVYTSKNLTERHKAEIDEFLNGLEFHGK